MVARASERARRRALSRETFEPSWPLAPVLAALLVGWVAMTWPWLVGQVTIPWDAKAHFQPQIQFLAQSLARGEWPFWTPNVFAGHPQIADPQAMIFSPPFLLLALATSNPSLWAVDVTVLLMQLAGAAALVAWFRDQDWHWAGALLAGLVFAFGASMAWRLQHTGQVLSLAYWPIAMLALDRAIRLGSYRWGAIAGAVAAFILLGRDQVALLVLYLVAAQAIWRIMQSDAPLAAARSTVGPALLGAAILIAIVAIPLALTASFAALSNRPAIDFEGAGRGSFHPALFLTFVIPQVFGAAYRMEDYWGPPSFAWNDTGLFIAQNMGQVYLGIVPLLLMLLAACQGHLLKRDIRFFTAAFVVATLYMLGWYTPVFRVIYELVPGVKFFRRPADATFLVGGLGAVLAGYAAHRIFSKPHDRINENAVAITAGVIVLAFFAALMLAMWLDRTSQLIGPLAIAAVAVVAGVVALAFVKPRIALEATPMALVLAAVTAADLSYNNGPSTSSALPPSVYDAMQPATRNATIALIRDRLAEAKAADTTGARRDRMEFLGVGFHWPNISMSQGFENTLGYNPLRLGLYSRATGAEDHVGLPDQRKFSPLLPSYKSLLIDMLGLRFIAAGEPLEWRDKSLKTADFKLIARTGDAWIYENPRAMPRVHVALRSEGVDFDDMLKTGRWPDGFDPATTVLLQGRGSSAVTSMGALSPPRPTARLLSYANTEIVAEAETPRGGWLVLADPWHPWWTAEIAGREVPLLRANVMFRAVEVPPGKQTVRFRFRPLLGLWRQWRGV